MCIFAFFCKIAATGEYFFEIACCFINHLVNVNFTSVVVFYEGINHGISELPFDRERGHERDEQEGFILAVFAVDVVRVFVSGDVHSSIFQI